MIVQGSCFILIAYDIGLQIDLDRCAQFLSETPERMAVIARHRAPRHFEYRSRPLRIRQGADPVVVGEFATLGNVDLTLYEFGAVSLTYRIPFKGSLDRLVALSEALYENAALACDSLLRVKGLLGAVRPAVTKPGLGEIGEDYLIFEMLREDGHPPVVELLDQRRHQVAQLLRSETHALAEEEIRETLRHQVSYSPEDLAIVNWNAALLYGEDAEDIRAVLELANVQLLEMRVLDSQLQRDLDHSYEVLSRQRSRTLGLFDAFSRDLRGIGQLQVDAALLFEGISNALKLLGDQYLARVYHVAVQRFHLSDWDGNITRKLNALESIYQKLADMVQATRSHILELIIILLILFEIVMPFVKH